MREVELQLETRPTDCSLPTYSPQPPSSFIIVDLPEWSENWYSFCRIVIYTVRAQASDKFIFRVRTFGYSGVDRTLCIGIREHLHTVVTV